MEIDPTHPCSNTFSSRQALPPACRKFGKAVDHAHILPGDLLLTRPFNAGSQWVSESIVKAQAKAYAPADAQWTHAAVCMGDNETICEANFGISGKQNGVMLRSLNEYADGKHALKIRRPKGLTDLQRQRIVVGAVNSLKKNYGYFYLLGLWWQAIRGQGLHDATGKGIRISANALVCSTLYADAVAYGANISIGRRQSVVVPAELSCSPLFDDNVPISWLQLI